MKYVCMPEPGKVEIREGEMPKEREGHAILKLLYGGICGSDLGTYRGTFPYVSYPRIPGHEFSAEIVQVGANSFGLKEGMSVTCNPYFNCGECYSCRRGYVNCCTSNETMGVQRDGAFCEYISMPVERIYDGKGLPAKTLAAIEPFCISYHAAKRAKIQPGERVLVVGGGTIGYLAAAAAKAMGAEVTLSDIAPDKLAFAEKTGAAAHTILNSSEEAFSEAAAELTGGDGFDVCMEAVGCPDTFMSVPRKSSRYRRWKGQSRFLLHGDPEEGIGYLRVPQRRKERFSGADRSGPRGQGRFGCGHFQSI